MLYPWPVDTKLVPTKFFNDTYARISKFGARELFGFGTCNSIKRFGWTITEEELTKITFPISFPNRKSFRVVTVGTNTWSRIERVSPTVKNFDVVLYHGWMPAEAQLKGQIKVFVASQIEVDKETTRLNDEFENDLQYYSAQLNLKCFKQVAVFDKSWDVPQLNKQLNLWS
jgi:hypothetical protein